MENNQRGFSGQEDWENQQSQNNRQSERGADYNEGAERDPANFSQDDDFTIDNENYDNISTGDYTGSESSSTLFEGSLSGEQSNFRDDAELDMDDETREAYSQEYSGNKDVRDSNDVNGPERGRSDFSGPNDDDVSESDSTQWTRNSDL